MIEIVKLQHLINKQNFDLSYEKCNKQKHISSYDAAVITCYILRDRIGLRNTLKVLYGFGLDHL